jgi:galactoside O-acetyltransferase
MNENTNIFGNLNKIKSRGKDSIIGRTVRIRRPQDFEIGRNSIVDDHTYISTQLKIGDFTHIGSGAHIIGGADAKVTIGNFVNIAPGCNIAAGANDYSGGELVSPALPHGYGGKAIIKPVKIADHCLIGFSCSILPGVELPEGVAIGAHSLVKPGKYKPWNVYAGVIAKEIKARNGKLIKSMAERIIRDVKEVKL